MSTHNMKTKQEKIKDKAMRVAFSFVGLYNICEDAESEFINFCAMRNLIPDRRALQSFAKFHKKQLTKRGENLAASVDHLNKLESYGK